MIFLFPIASPAKRYALTVVGVPPTCVGSPAEPFAGVESLGIEKVTLMLILLCRFGIIKYVHLLFGRRISCCTAPVQLTV